MYIKENAKKFLRCLKCNRILKTSISQSRGYGEFCWKQRQKELQINSSLLFANRWNIQKEKGEKK